MSGSSGSEDCPRCGGIDSLQTSADWKPIDSGDGVCLKCGFSYYTKTELLDLEAVNDYRKDYERRPIKQLAKPCKAWIKSGYS